MKKGVEIVPEENYRIRSEDIFEVNTNLQSNPQDFGKKGASSKASTSTNASSDDLDDDFPDNKMKGQAFREASQTLYARKGDKTVGL